MFKWFKSHFERKKIEKLTRSKFVKEYFEDPELWHISRESVARGVAIGLFTAAVPIMPFQTLMAIVFSILIRANLAVSLGVSWVSNPITLVPIAYLTRQVGSWVLNLGQSKVQIFIHELTQDLHLGHQSSIPSWLVQSGKEFFVGLPIVALTAALAGYLVVRLVWFVGMTINKHKAK